MRRLVLALLSTLLLALPLQAQRVPPQPTENACQRCMTDCGALLDREPCRNNPTLCADQVLFCRQACERRFTTQCQQLPR